MPDPNRAYAGAMAFWGSISAAAAARETAAQVQTRVSAEAARLGVGTTFGTRIEIGRLFSSAVALRRATEQLSAASPGDAFTNQMLAPLPYGGRLLGAGGLRIFDVRINYSAVRNGTPTEDYITLRFSGGLPATVGDLRSSAEEVAGILAETYGTSYSGLGAITIGEL